MFRADLSGLHLVYFLLYFLYRSLEACVLSAPPCFSTTSRCVLSHLAKDGKEITASPLKYHSVADGEGFHSWSKPRPMMPHGREETSSTNEETRSNVPYPPPTLLHTSRRSRTSLCLGRSPGRKSKHSVSLGDCR